MRRVGHALLPEHLFEDIGELLILSLLAGFFLVVLVFGALALVGEEVPGPGVEVGLLSLLLLVGSGLFGVGEGVEAAGRGAGGAGAGEEFALGVVFAAAGGIGEGVICVVDELEFAGSFGTVRVVGRDAVGVGF